MHPGSDVPKMLLRPPRDVKEWLKAQSQKYGSSQHSEVIRAIRERMDRETAAGEPARNDPAAA